MTYTHPHAADDYNAALPRALAGRMISVLFLLSGLVTVVSSFLPSELMISRAGVLAVGLAGMVVGLSAGVLPWQRWPRHRMLWCLPLAFVLISLHNLFSGADPYHYTIFYLIAFIWLGIAQPRGVAFWFIPLFVFSYMAPLLLLDRTNEAIRSVIYALPVCLLISEALAWVADRLRKVQLALSRSEARFRSLVQHASDMVLITAEDATIRYLSPSVERILGHSTTALLHTKLLDLIHPDDLPAIQATFDLVLQQPGVTGPIECRIRHQDGSWRYIETTSTNLSDDANVQGIVLNSRDITERKALEAQLKHQAFHDPLTGLVNRAAFSDRVEHALMRMERRGATLAVLFLDLDNFKTVNDQYGHAAGDQLLVTVAERLRECLRASDVAARLGGDEFAILLDEVNDTSNVVQVAERLLHALRLPFILEGQPVNVGVSIGIAWSYPGQSAADLLRHADIAMYSVKHTGKGRYAVFEQDAPFRPRHEPMIEFSGSTH